MKKNVIPIRLDHEEYEKLKIYADAYKTSVSGFVRDYLIKPLPPQPPEIPNPMPESLEQLPPSRG